MAEHSSIEWTDATWNPITGCTLVSEGCRHCYAATLAATRLKHLPSREGLARINAAGEAKFTGEVRFNEQWLDQPLRWRRPRMIFVCAHGDLFHESVPDEWIDRVFAVMARATQHTFQVLTKRPERMRDYVASFKPVVETTSRVLAGLHSFDKVVASGPPIPSYFSESGHQLEDRRKGSPIAKWPNGWPLPNVWLGTSIEDQAMADARIPHLLATPAAVRFVSAEPLLGPVSLDDMCDGTKFLDVLRGNWWHDCDPPYVERGQPHLDWVIVGGESGKHARPMHPDWVRSLRDQCVSAEVPFFFKQWGEWTPDDLPSELQESDEIAGRWDGVSHRVGKAHAGRQLDGREWNEMPGGAA